MLDTGVEASYGLLIVKVATDTAVAIYRVENQSLTEISATASTFSTTKDNASRYNFYWETDQFKVQNKVRDDKSISVAIYAA